MRRKFEASATLQNFESHVLICAPYGRDAGLIASALSEAGIQASAVKGMNELCDCIPQTIGAGVIAEEALSPQSLAALSFALEQQDPWSDLPLIVLTSGGQAGTERTWRALQGLEPAANVTLLERPLRTMTLVSAVQVALRSRHRQYEVRMMQADLEQRVEERTRELQRLISEAEGFSYTISHDLRAPLRSIVATSQILLEDFAQFLPEAAKAELCRQSRAASNLAQLIDDLLKLSRLARESMRPVDFDLTAAAQEVAAQVEAETGGACTIIVEPGLVAHGDPILVRFVMLNLIQNACKFSPHGGCVHVGKTEDGTFYVSDRGIGFDQRYAQKMFLPFERLVGSNEFPGTGIGLANVKRIIERHGGSVWATSEGLGRGSTFFFTL